MSEGIFESQFSEGNVATEDLVGTTTPRAGIESSNEAYPAIRLETPFCIVPPAVSVSPTRYFTQEYGEGQEKHSQFVLLPPMLGGYGTGQKDSEEARPDRLDSNRNRRGAKRAKRLFSPSSVAASKLVIGKWICTDCVSKFYFGRRQLVWEIHFSRLYGHNGKKVGKRKKIELQFDIIQQIALQILEDRVCMKVSLVKAPLLFKERPTGTGRKTEWEPAVDFTIDRQASKILLHELEFAVGTLDRVYAGRSLIDKLLLSFQLTESADVYISRNCRREVDGILILKASEVKNNPTNGRKARKMQKTA